MVLSPILSLPCRYVYRTAGFDLGPGETSTCGSRSQAVVVMAAGQLLPVFPPLQKHSRQWAELGAVVPLSGEALCPQNNAQSVGHERDRESVVDVCLCVRERAVSVLHARVHGMYKGGRGRKGVGVSSVLESATSVLCLRATLC